MSGYRPLYIKGMEQGLIQSRQDFILPDDAYPVLQNAYVWREQIKRKQGFSLLDRLRRKLTAETEPNPDGTATYSNDLLDTYRATEPNAQIEAGTVSFYLDKGLGNETLYQDTNSDGVMFLISGPFTISSGSINYATGIITLNFSSIPGTGIPSEANLNYFPALPAMGLCGREQDATNNESTIAFDTKYAYKYSNGWEEFISGTTWSGTDSDFFWNTNYWVGSGNLKIFWVTNDSGSAGDPIRYTNGTAWVNFAPTIDSVGTKLQQCLAMLPFRGRMVTFNTLEGATLGGSTSFSNRIRWAAIGNPFSDEAVPTVTDVNENAWRDDIRGQGGFLDIPTSQSIIAVGFVRDYLVVYCERSTWQLMYTGRSIAPFQIQKINSELGAESTFSAVQFDTSLVGVGQLGIVECDSTKSVRIDIKIPDLVFQFSNTDSGTKRVHGIRNFQERLAYWTYADKDTADVYPNRRLVYNYENASWAIFTDSLTCFGNFQPDKSARWLDFPSTDPAKSWENQNYPWSNRPALVPLIIAGNQQGFIEYLDSQVTNDMSLFIQAITGATPTATLITSPNHNLADGQVIEISGIPAGTPFATSLNDGIFGIVKASKDTFYIYTYNSQTQLFDLPQADSSASYVGKGVIAIRDNFSVVSKKFNFLDDGQNIQLGYVDVLLASTSKGEITMNVYMDYNNNSPVNTLPENVVPATGNPDSFFNSVVPTVKLNGIEGSKYWQRVHCAARGNFITIEWTLSNAQMNSSAQESRVQIDSCILWRRPAGRNLSY